MTETANTVQVCARYFAYVELLPGSENDGRLNVIGTNFSNSAFPLLRYDTGDIAIPDPEGCNCGLP